MAAFFWPFGWSCLTPAGGAEGAISCTVSSFASGASAQFILDVKVNASLAAGTVISNIAVASTFVFDPDEANDSAMIAITVSAAAGEVRQLQVSPFRVLK